MPETRTSWEITSQEVSLVAPEKLRMVKEFLAFAVRTLKTMLLYPQNNPIPSEFKKNLFEKFSNYLDEYEELKLVAEQNKILLSGEVVHEDPPQEEGLALALYRDGIRELIFKNGLKLEELENFLEAIKVALQSKSGEDDLVTLLWEKDYLHLRYTVIEQASDLPEPLLLESTSTEELEKIYYSEISLGEEELAPLQEGKPMLELADLVSEEIARLLKNITSFEREELAEINSLLQIERFYRRQAEAIPILFEILLQEEDSAGFNEVLSLIEKILEEFLADCRFDLAAEVLKQYRKNQEDFRGRLPARADRLALAVEHWGEKDQLSKLAGLLNQDKELPTDQIYQYLVLLSPNSIPQFIGLLGELRTFSSRKLLCQVLEYFAHNHLEQVASGIYDKRWYVVRNLAMILGRTQDPRIATYLKRTLKHSDFRVRKETILALSRLNTAEANLLLVESLADPDRKIRINATRALAAAREKKALEPLWLQINRPDFWERGEDEIKESFEALVSIGEEEGLEYVYNYIRKFQLWHRARYQECKLLALKALEKSSNPNLSGYLEKMTKLKNKTIRTAARRLLDHLTAKSQRKKEQTDAGKN